MSIYRARFRASHDDPRPLNQNLSYPYWVTGYGSDFAIVVAYVPSDDFLYENWPEATNVELISVDSITFTDRFPRPDWYQEDEE